MLQTWCQDTVLRRRRRDAFGERDKIDYIPFILSIVNDIFLWADIYLHANKFAYYDTSLGTMVKNRNEK